MWVISPTIHVEVSHGDAKRIDTDSSPYCVMDDDMDCLKNLEMEGNELSYGTYDIYDYIQAVFLRNCSRLFNAIGYVYGAGLQWDVCVIICEFLSQNDSFSWKNDQSHTNCESIMLCVRSSVYFFLPKPPEVGKNSVSRVTLKRVNENYIASIRVPLKHLIEN